VAILSDRTLTRFSESLGAAGLRLAGKWNVPIYRATRGRLLGRVGRAPVLLLTTTGRKSARRRTAPVLYLRRGGDLVVIGSNAGNANAPAWALNLQANPDATVEIGGEKREMHARIAEREERTELWNAMSDQYSGFDHYRERTSRDIRVFVLEPRR
jgi:deazaflavin-dependent oxidoreductase (nitroreductase family)